VIGTTSRADAELLGEADPFSVREAAEIVTEKAWSSLQELARIWGFHSDTIEELERVWHPFGIVGLAACGDELRAELSALRAAARWATDHAAAIGLLTPSHPQQGRIAAATRELIRDETARILGLIERWLNEAREGEISAASSEMVQ
jgi:hypothetical protein